MACHAGLPHRGYGALGPTWHFKPRTYAFYRSLRYFKRINDRKSLQHCRGWFNRNGDAENPRSSQQNEDQAGDMMRQRDQQNLSNNENLVKVMNDEMSKRMARMTEEVGKSQQKLEEEAQRARVLAPFRVSAPKYGIIGNSRYSVALRKKIIEAALDEERKPVLLFGEPGLHKFNTASLIHFGGKNGKYPLISIDCTKIDDIESNLFGRGEKKGILTHWMPAEGTVLLTNVHRNPRLLDALLPFLSVDGRRHGISGESSMSEDELDYESVEEEAPVMRYPRIVMTAEMRVPSMDHVVDSIQIAPLRVRPQDIKDITDYLLRQMSRSRGMKLTLTPEALRRLEAGKYPNNISELEGAVQRAVAQATPSQKGNEPSKGETLVIGDEVFWFASGQKSDQFRADLLRPLPLLKAFLRSDFWPRQINFNFTAYVYAILILYLFLGPQTREQNIGLVLIWSVWWPVSFLLHPFLGRVWCTVCPFMIYGELVQRLRISSGAKLMKWPKEVMDKWGYAFLFWLFAGILVWEEVWDLPHSAALSSCLLLLITAGAMIGSFFFERRIWCRYLCPIGGMNGLFAKMALTELRASQGLCSAECSTYGCFKGNPQEVPPEGLKYPGCPLYSHPAQLTDNRNCVLCMDCLKTCPHRSVEFRMRLPGADLWNSAHKPLVGELSLSFILLGSVVLHKIPVLFDDFGFSPFEETIFYTSKGYHILLSLGILFFPGVVAWLVDAGWRGLCEIANSAYSRPLQLTTGSNDPDTSRAIGILTRASQNYSATSAGSWFVSSTKPFLDIGYGYLPLAWSSIFTYYLEYMLLEAGHVLQVGGRSLGMDPSTIPAWEANPAIVSFLQGCCLLLGISSSLVLSRKIVGQPWKTFWPQCMCIVLFGCEIWHVIFQKM